jgi:hypothetical protein
VCSNGYRDVNFEWKKEKMVSKMVGDFSIKTILQVLSNLPVYLIVEL